MSKRMLLALLAVGLVGTMLPAQQTVTIRVNVAQPQGGFRPVWAYVGHDEPNSIARVAHTFPPLGCVRTANPLASAANEG